MDNNNDKVMYFSNNFIDRLIKSGQVRFIRDNSMPASKAIALMTNMSVLVACGGGGGGGGGSSNRSTVLMELSVMIHWLVQLMMIPSMVSLVMISLMVVRVMIL